MLDVRECIEKNSSLILAKSKVSYSEGQSSPLELGFGVELGLNSHSKNLRVLTNISTSFTFTIERAATENIGDGFTFYIGYQIPPNATNGTFGLFNVTSNPFIPQVAALDFDL